MITVESLEIHVSNHCNLSCRGCSHISPLEKKEFLNEENMYLVLKKLSSVLHCKVIRLLGGEPTLNSNLENIVSKIFGDIKDYSFDKLSYIEKTPEGTYIVDARMPLYELQEKTGLQLLTKTEEEEIDVDTIGGFVASLAGKVPSVGEKISHNSTNVLFKVLDVSPRKINKLEIIIPN